MLLSGMQSQVEQVQGMVQETGQGAGNGVGQEAIGPVVAVANEPVSQPSVQQQSFQQSVQQPDDTDHVDLESILAGTRQPFGIDKPGQSLPNIGPVDGQSLQTDVGAQASGSTQVPVQPSSQPQPSTQPQLSSEEIAEAELRFKSHLEAEKGYKHLLREKTRIEQERKAMEQELLQYRQKMQQQQEEVKRLESEAAFQEYAAARHEMALEEIDNLDPDDENYRKNVARIWAAKDADILRASQQYAVLKELTKSPASSSAPDQTVSPVAFNSTGTAAIPATAPVSNETEILQAKINEALAKEGLSSDDPLFWGFAGKAPDRDNMGNPIDIDAQINWAITQTRNYQAALLARGKQEVMAMATERGVQSQLRAQPMGIGGRRTDSVIGGNIVTPGSSSSGSSTPTSIDEVLEFVLEQRRL